MATNNKQNNKNEVVIKRIEDAIENLKNKNFNIFFFIVDSKNVPNGSMNYIYQMAKALHDKEYNVTMCYQLDDEYSAGELAELEAKGQVPDGIRRFVGVEEWLGEEYSSLHHMNIQKEEWQIGPADIIFIPEVFSSIMYQTFKNKVPCKRYVILQNFGYVTEFIPFGHQWATYGIDHVVTNTAANAELINRLFPYTKEHTTVLPPYIQGFFRKPVKAKKLIVNIIAKNQDDINRIMKPFYWKYPVYQFVSFQDLRGLPKKEFAEQLQEGCITIWLDEYTPFGYSALEAMRCGNIVIGKVPQIIPDWMTDENGVWFTDINDVPDILAKVVATVLEDEIPEQMEKAMDETAKLFTYETYEKNIDRFIEQAIQERINELIAVKQAAKNNEFDKPEEN
jgi:glycosyltransferase involved in cell wall biosynthesis